MAPISLANIHTTINWENIYEWNGCHAPYLAIILAWANAYSRMSAMLHVSGTVYVYKKANTKTPGHAANHFYYTYALQHK